MGLFDFIADCLGGNADDFSQTESEAFIDAVVYAMLIDRRIDSNEEEELARQLDRLPWQSEVLKMDYVKSSSQEAGRNLSFEQKAAEYCAGIAGRLQREAAREVTLRACRNIVRSDGELKPVEQALVRELCVALGDSE